MKLGRRTNLVGQLRDREAVFGFAAHESVVVLRRESQGELSPEGAASLIVVTRPTAGPLDGVAGVAGAQHQGYAPEGNLNVAGQRPLASTQGPLHDAHHPEVALEGANSFRFTGAHRDIGDEPGDGRQGDARLAEGGQDVGDVVQKEWVGAHH